MNFRSSVLLTLLVVMGASSSFAQSNRVLDLLLAQKEAACAESAYLALVGGGWLPEDTTPTEAYALAMGKKWLPKGSSAETPIKLQDFSLLAMRGMKTRGGVGWTLFRSKRYAYRELIARGVANGSGGPGRIPSGEEVIRMIGQLAEDGGRLK